ncbi:Gfo/Idh/MocA family oxidoreductase [Arthrobacter sp. H14]|uniref:Gfo/Idh/MocA family oxidoreductase n=1 Tax=Arthrobacter sp. H14 TaxID=1312959 RepID=UPI00047A5E1D|nr:Gfo/Idh/MocA family oxidoreductase [Arthrobacter sp. H14]
MTIRVGVIGAGIMGADHIRNLSRNIGSAKVSYVADVDRQRAESAAAVAGANPTTDPGELIASGDVDAVLIASHDSTHAELILESFEAGKPVLCEKPLAPSVEEGRRVVKADEEIIAATGTSLLSLGFMRRSDPGYVELKDALASGRVGDAVLVHCVSRNSASAPGATSESAVRNSAVHELDIIPWLLESPITEVSWHAGKPSPGAPAGLADPQLMLFRTANGVLTTLELFLNAEYGYSTRCEIVGEHGALSLVEPVSVAVDVERARSTGYARDWRPRFADAYRIELQAWISSLVPGAEGGPGVDRGSTLATARDGLQASIVADSVIDSMHNGGAWTAVGRIA